MMFRFLLRIFLGRFSAYDRLLVYPLDLKASLYVGAAPLNASISHEMSDMSSCTSLYHRYLHIHEGRGLICISMDIAY